MMDASVFEYLRSILLNRRWRSPAYGNHPFIGSFQPKHLQCHQTAVQVAVETGLVPVVGVQFLDLNSKLYPWPHIVNRGAGDVLIDFSPKVAQPRLAFIETGWDEFAMWRAVTAAYNPLVASSPLPRWGEVRADALNDEFMAPLCAYAANALPS